MNLIFRFLIIIAPILILVFFTKVLLIDEDNKLINFESKIFPEFEMRDLNGNQVSAQSLSGIKILNVWASWCITCLVEHPFLSQLSEKNIEIVGLNYKDADSKAIAWLQKHGNPYIFSIYDPRGDLAFDLGVTGAPETFLIFDNEIIAHVQGEINQQKWESIFLPLINNNQDQS